jgi:hypothetical protein
MPLPFAEHHRDFWRWVWDIQTGRSTVPYVAIWPRDGGKSTNAELCCVALGAKKARNYIIYVSGTQDQADDHVANISALLESRKLEYMYPDLTARALTKFGHSKGWRRNRLRTRQGFTVDALGLNTAIRGMKLEQARPDLIILDDIDDELDTLLTVEKKLKMLQTKILPAGAPHVAVLGVQNLVHRESVFSRFVDGRADFLANRIMSGPHPALLSMTCEQRDGRTVLTGGIPTWDGLSLQRCQEIVDTIGMSAFMSEHQHEQHEVEGALWDREILDSTRVQDTPELVRIVVAVDPPATSGLQSAEAGIVVAGKGRDDHGYVLADWSARATPDEWARRAVGAYHQYEADRIIGEVNHGGEMVEHTVRTVSTTSADRRIPYTGVRAGRGQSKVIRAEPVAALYEQGICHHLGHFPKLEDQLCTWRQGEKSPDRLDALVWAMTHLMLDRAGKIRVTSIS